MKLSKIMLGLGAAALISMPAVAQVSSMRAVAPLTGEESEMDEAGTVVVAILGAAAVIGAIIVATDNDDTEIPVSG